MSKTSRIPPPLEPFLRLPPELSLLLFTQTLGCSATWLVSRLVAGVLGDGASRGVEIRKESGFVNDREGGSEEGEETAVVVLVSWMRDEAYWKGELRRCCGLDTARLSSRALYTFIPALSATRPAADLQSLLLPHLGSLFNQTPKRKVHLILDSPETLLYLSPSTTATTLLTDLLTLRSRVHSMSILTSADAPFLSAATQSASTASTPLELETARLLTGFAHQASCVLGCRELGTGAAKDVSGVVRVGRGGGGWDGEAEEEGEGKGRKEDKGFEALYLVQRDGRAEVFERRALGGGRG